jgi:hypothetical protein
MSWLQPRAIRADVPPRGHGAVEPSRVVALSEAIHKQDWSITSLAGSVRGLCLIYSPPVRADDLDFFAADTLAITQTSVRLDVWRS